MFKTELHCHSNDISLCASIGAEEIVEKFVEAGYSTVVLANHFNSYTMKKRGYASYSDFVKSYAEAYDKLKECAAGRLNILFGAEIRFDENTNDYLLFGATVDFLLENEGLFELNPKSFCKIARESGVLFVQAHPFRNKMTVVEPSYLDGIEVFNGHIEHDSRNPITEAWAERFGLIKTSGSDIHHASHFADAGILTECEIKTTDELVAVLKRGNYELVKDESHFKKSAISFI